MTLNERRAMDRSETQKRAREEGLEVTDVIHRAIEKMLQDLGEPEALAKQHASVLTLSLAILFPRQQIVISGAAVKRERDRWIYENAHHLERVQHETGLSLRNIRHIIRKYRIHNGHHK